MSFPHRLLPLLLALAIAPALGAKKRLTLTETGRSLLKDRPDCVTWVSATVRVEVSTGGRSYPPREEKLEALGTVLAEDGLVVLSHTQVDPTASILSRIRSPGASVNVNYKEVKILMSDGDEVPARLVLKDTDLDLVFLLPEQNGEETNATTFRPVASGKARTPQPLDEVLVLGKLNRNLYRQSTLRKGWVSAVISKPRDYFVVEQASPGAPVFDARGAWLGVGVYKMVAGRPTQVVVLPATDVLEIAEQVRHRTE